MKTVRADDRQVTVLKNLLDRLGLDLSDLDVTVLPLEVFLPAPGQAALAIEARVDGDLHELLAAIEHADTRRCVDAERAFLAELGGDCSLPAAAFATLSDGNLSIEGRLLSVDGRTVLRHTGIDGAVVARHLLDHGGADLLGR